MISVPFFSPLARQPKNMANYTPPVLHTCGKINTVTGGFVYGAVAVTAVYMLIETRIQRKKVPGDE